MEVGDLNKNRSDNDSMKIDELCNDTVAVLLTSGVDLPQASNDDSGKAGCELEKNSTVPLILVGCSDKCVENSNSNKAVIDQTGCLSSVSLPPLTHPDVASDDPLSKFIIHCPNNAEQSERVSNKAHQADQHFEKSGENRNSLVNLSPEETLSTEDIQIFTSDKQEDNLDYFTGIPDEIFLKILSYLTPQELFRWVSPVCQRWRQFANDPLLWQHLDLSDYHLEPTIISELVKKCPHLKRLTMQGTEQMTIPVAKIFTDSCQGLEELNFGFSQNMDSHKLTPFVEGCPKLTSVNVEGCPLIDSSAIKVLSSAKSLHCLNLSYCSKLTDCDLIHLAETLPRITELNVDGIAFITDQAVIAIVHEHSKYLVSLILDGEELTDSSIEAIADCTLLTKLSLSFTELLTDQSLSFIQEMPGLKLLRLRKGYSLTNQGLCGLFSGPQLRCVTHLDLTDCTAVDDVVVLSFAKCCGLSLRRLHLSWCWNITETGLISIIDHCSNLRHLDLVGLHQLRGECLDRIPEELPYLKLLDLQQCNEIQDQILFELVKRKVDLLIFDYYGQEIIFSRKEEASSIPTSP